ERATYRHDGQNPAHSAITCRSPTSQWSAHVSGQWGQSGRWGLPVMQSDRLQGSMIEETDMGTKCEQPKRWPSTSVRHMALVLGKCGTVPCSTLFMGRSAR